MRQTCRRGRDISNERAYWSHTFHRLQQNLPVPCHWNTSEEALSAHQIEARVKWLLRLDRKWKSGNPTPINYTTIPYSYKGSEGFRLLPGGKWLLTYTAEGVRVWDAGGKVANAAQHVPSPSRPPTPAILYHQWDIDIVHLPAVYNVALLTARRG